MSEEIMNTSSVNYTFAGSTEVFSGTSNIATVTLRNENDILVTKVAQNETFVPGDTVTYVVTITNNGASYFTGVRVVDNLGTNNYLSYVSGSAMLYYNQQYLRPEIASTNPLTFTLSPLSPGQTMILTYSCRVLSSLPATITSITNTVEATGYTYNSTVTGASSAEITRSSTASLSIVKTATSDSVAPGEIFSYLITLTNQGTATANVARVTDSLPSNFNITSVKLKIGSGTTQTLASSDYVLDASNNFTLPSATGPTITVPGTTTSGPGQTVITITGYFGT